MKKKIRRRTSTVTLHDVARRAGVSPMTVSRFLDGSRIVRQAARVKAAIKELGYSPNVAARSLASAQALKIGLLYGNPSATFTSEFLVELFENARRFGCQLVIDKCASSGGERRAAQKLIDEGIDGVVLPTPVCDSDALLRQFEEANVPTVAVGTGRERMPGLSLRIDNAGAAALMTRYLLSLGHREIGFIKGHASQIDSRQRYEGFKHALKEAGTGLRPQLVKQGRYTFRSGFDMASALLRGSRRPTAIFASNDDMAAGALAAAHRMKLDVPAELSIVGFDDTPLASAIWPRLTTIRQPLGSLTRRALNMLVSEIRRRRRGELPFRREEVVNLSLVERESAARIAT